MPVEQVDVIDARLLLKSLRAFKKGDFSVRLPSDQIGLAGDIAEAFNDSVELAAQFASELARTRNVVGQEGQTSERINLRNAYGSWADSADSVNYLIDDLKLIYAYFDQKQTDWEKVKLANLSPFLPLQLFLKYCHLHRYFLL